MQPHRIVLIGGGTRSGKSRFAVDVARRLGPRRAFVATATPSDAEMRTRIERHRRDRGDGFETFEEPIALAERLAGFDDYDVVVVDCVTHWLSNLLLRNVTLEKMLTEVDRVAAVLGDRRYHAVLVTNEVGMSIHPATEIGRRFVEAAGFAHQRLAAVADDLYMAALGVVIRLDPVRLDEMGTRIS